MAVNKVVINNETKLDLTADTVDAAHLAKGFTAHDMKGESIVGTMESGGVSGSYIKCDYLRERTINNDSHFLKFYIMRNPQFYGFKKIPRMSYLVGALYMDDTVECMSEFQCILNSNISNIRFSENEKFTTIPERGINGLSWGGGETIVIPDNVTTLGNFAFGDIQKSSSIFNPTKIKMSKNITQIGHSFQGHADRAIILDFSRSDSIPILTNSMVGDKWMPSGYSYYLYNIAYIIVPDALYDEWIKATNWVNWANKIKKASEVTA